MENRARSVAKAVSWRVVATLTTVALVVVFSKNLALGTFVGIAELAVKTVIFYVHERIWNLSDFGRKRSKVAV